MSAPDSLVEQPAGPLQGPAGSTNNSQQQMSNTSMPTPSAFLNGAFFDSPMLSNAMLDFHARQMSPPTSTSFLSLSMPETPTTYPKSLEPANAGNKEQALKRSVAVVNRLMNAEKLQQTQKKKEDPTQGQRGLQQGRLFAPLDSGVRGSPQPMDNDVNTSSNGGGIGSNVPGPMTNMLRANRLSSTGQGVPDEGYLDLPFSGNEFLLFSPHEMARSLGGNNMVPESPITQNLRSFPPYPSGYNTMIPPGAQWQFSSIPNLTTPVFPTGSLQSEPHQQQLSAMSKTKSAKKRKQINGDDDDYDDDDDDDKPKKRKTIAKPVDPNEPKITSKHRGVCWYKRTKKWVVQTKVNGKRVHVGYFDDEEEAAEAYKSAVQGIQQKKALEAKQKSVEDMARSAQTHN